MGKEVNKLLVENILGDLIRIQTVNPPGGEIEVAKRFLLHQRRGYYIPLFNPAGSNAGNINL